MTLQDPGMMILESEALTSFDSQVSHLEIGYLASLREFCPASDHPEHILTDAQVP